MRADLFIVNIGQLATPQGRGPQRGPEMKRLQLLSHASILVEDGIIAYAGVQEGPDYEAPSKKPAPATILLTPAVNPRPRLVTATPLSRRLVGR